MVSHATTELLAEMVLAIVRLESLQVTSDLYLKLIDMQRLQILELEQRVERLEKEVVAKHSL